MKNYKLYTSHKRLLADTTTPVSIYLRLRDVFPNSILLESSDYHSRENSLSYVCCDPIAGIVLNGDKLETYFPDGTREQYPLSDLDLKKHVSDFRKQFESTSDTDFKFISNGLFGYFAYETIEHFEDIKLQSGPAEGRDIPLMQYHVYRYIIIIDHFKNELYLLEHRMDKNAPDGLEKIQYLIQNKNFTEYKFSLNGEEKSNFTDQEFIELVEKVKKHVYRGDVFQIVPSRAFSKPFLGDEFNVYRSLRSINPSPYLFFFDYGDFKIFGSSPEAQIIVKDRKAEIHPIAGTFKRTGDDEKDAVLAKQLSEDKKENSEHVMLVDLARNDLSRNGHDVQVEKYREVQFFSHVIHLVSKVIGKIKENTPTMQIVADTFPAGTLSGAPKHKAMQLIEKYEKTSRAFYGGAIGFMDFDGNYTHAIMIRTFLSKDYQLHWQAGAGIVSKSSSENELQEVYNKLGALTKAIKLAETI